MKQREKMSIPFPEKKSFDMIFYSTFNKYMHISHSPDNANMLSMQEKLSDRKPSPREREYESYDYQEQVVEIVPILALID